MKNVRLFRKDDLPIFLIFQIYDNLLNGEDDEDG